jgi:hypothetical protein
MTTCLWFIDLVNMVKKRDFDLTTVKNTTTKALVAAGR